MLVTALFCDMIVSLVWLFVLDGTLWHLFILFLTGWFPYAMVHWAVQPPSSISPRFHYVWWDGDIDDDGSVIPPFSCFGFPAKDFLRVWDTVTCVLAAVMVGFIAWHEGICCAAIGAFALFISRPDPEGAKAMTGDEYTMRLQQQKRSANEMHRTELELQDLRRTRLAARADKKAEKAQLIKEQRIAKRKQKSR